VKLSPEAQRAYRKQRYGEPPTIDGAEVVELRRFVDETGAMTELLRLDEGRPRGVDGFALAQVNYSTLEPGAIKAFHLHLRQTDVWYVPPEDRVLLVMVDQRQGSPTSSNRVRLVLGDGASRLVRIPPGVAHGCKNLASHPGRVLYFTDLHFSADPETSDEGRLPWDFFGAELWETPRG
jgi:dTDP-4-dehydrorhamnose 3,5-epimerase